MEADTKRIYSPDKEHWFEIKELGELRMGWSGCEIKTSFGLDGTDDFKLADGGAYFRDNNTFLIYDYRGLVIYFLNEKVALHLFRPVDMERSACSLDTSDPQNPILIISVEGLAPKRLEVFKSLQSFSPGRNFF